MSDQILDKTIWSEADFDQMEWHDATIHAVGFDAEAFELLFDIDYICRWLLADNSSHYSFWVAPATLTLENVYNVCLDTEPVGNLTVDRLARADEGRPRNG